jgi:hypothetical protein
MTERERWIVYPLLFLALGAALRDKLFDRTTTKSIVCQELMVVDAEPIGSAPVNVLARIGRIEPNSGGPSSGLLMLNGRLDVQGVVNAHQYRYQGVPFVPALPMGVTWPDFFRAMQQAAQNKRQGDAPAQPEATPQESSRPAEPLADPADTR